jgi:hypothetical protein
LFADGAYDRTKLLDKAAFLDFVIEIVRRIDRRLASKCCRADVSSNEPLAG